MQEAKRRGDRVMGSTEIDWQMARIDIKRLKHCATSIKLHKKGIKCYAFNNYLDLRYEMVQCLNLKVNVTHLYFNIM